MKREEGKGERAVILTFRYMSKLLEQRGQYLYLACLKRISQAAHTGNTFTSSCTQKYDL